MSTEKLKKAWSGRNPCHELNSDTGEDMFWGTLKMVIDELINTLNALKSYIGNRSNEWVKVIEAETSINKALSGDNKFCSHCEKRLRNKGDGTLELLCECD